MRQHRHQQQSHVGSVSASGMDLAATPEGAVHGHGEDEVEQLLQACATAPHTEPKPRLVSEGARTQRSKKQTKKGEDGEKGETE